MPNLSISKAVRYGLLSYLLFSCLVPVWGQHYDREHRHAVELTSGPAPFVYSGIIPLTTTAQSQGQSASNVLILPVNLGYTLSFCERWELNAILNYGIVAFNREQYPSKDGGYDFSAKPVSSERETHHVFSLSADMRWKWMRKDYVSLYSALGLGWTPGAYFTFRGAQLPMVIPYIAPIGIKAGGKHFYGLTELNVSASASFVLAGVGYRF